MNPHDQALADYAVATQAGPARRVRRGNAWRPALVLSAAVGTAIVTLRPAALDQPFEAAGTREVASGIVATWDGTGSVVGTGRAPVFTWSTGQIDLDVKPGAGIQLRVQTEEAEVRVIGTRFRVTRDAFGTRVEVVHGRVGVRCVDGTDTEVGGGDSTVCAPIHAAGLLRRARAEQQAGDPAAALASVDAGLRDAALTAVVQDELLAVRVALLTELGRFDDAVVAAAGYLGRPAPVRAEEVARLGLGAAGTPTQRCQFLVALADVTEVEAAQRARCREESGTPTGATNTRHQEGER
jgi:hypothetical protein